ncbi:hypothetical protein JTB14_002085 [Gonioctena quinquepunctata]|nr:hypothetical protein JTB14_002085 [Gonioctena quinquepunctata]
MNKITLPEDFKEPSGVAQDIKDFNNPSPYTLFWAEVITSVEAVARLKQQIKEPKKTVASTTKKKGKAVKIKRVYEEETDEESLEGIEENSDNDYNLDNELAEFGEENEFVTSLDKTPERIEKGDWILVKFATKKLFQFYVGQVTAVKPCLEAKFARRSRSLSSQFHWPDTADVSVINADQIHLYLPPPNIHKRGHFNFNITFEQNVY